MAESRGRRTRPVKALIKRLLERALGIDVEVVGSARRAISRLTPTQGGILAESKPRFALAADKTGPDVLLLSRHPLTLEGGRET